MDKKAQVYAKQYSTRIGQKKVMPVANLIRGKNTLEAKKVLAFDNTKAAKALLKVLTSAEANAKNNLNIDPHKMYIADLRVDDGPVFKRGRIVARGRLSPIIKRTSHIVLGLSERNSK